MSYFFPIYAISNDLTQDEVIIEYMGGTPFSDVIAFAIEGFQNVLDTERNCVSSCPERAGFETSVEDGTPLVCIFCNQELLEEFNHRGGGCKCLDSY